MRGYVTTFKVKDREKDKNNKLILSVQMMISYHKNIKPFGLRLKCLKSLKCFTSL